MHDHQNPVSHSELPPVSFAQLFRYSTRIELLFDAIGLVAAIAAGSTEPLMNFVFGNLVEEFVSFSLQENGYLSDPNNQTALQQLEQASAQFRVNASLHASYFVYIGVAMLFCTFIYMVTWVHTGEVNARRIRELYLRAVLRQDVAYFDTVGAGEVATHIQTDTHLVQQAMSEKVAIVAFLASAFCTGFIFAYASCWRLALAMSAVIPCIAIAGIVMNTFVAKYMQRSLKHIATGGTIAGEVISTIRTAHAFGTQNILKGIYDVEIQNSRVFDTRSALSYGVGWGVIFFAMYSGYALAFQFGTTLINEGHATAGDVVNVFLSIMVGSFSLLLMAPEMQVIIRGRSAAAKLYATIERIPDINSSDTSGLRPGKVTGEITLEDVKFNYPSRPDVPIVKGIDITFVAGQTAALVGASGSGKSTIISLIERFYDPHSGSVKLDGVDIRTLNIKWLRSQIGLVSQEPTLFATTIKDNVGHGLINTPYEHSSEEEKLRLIRDACIKANADGFISKLTDGYDTMVGERGFLLSGGQKQRIAIARAIVSDPRILLLDEATSALDTQSEGIVQDALEKAAAGRTTITIAHRLSTVKDADCIYVMGEGQILEKGTHMELLADENSTYARLVQTQRLREAEEVEETDGTTTAASSTSDDSETGESMEEKDIKEKISLDCKEIVHFTTSDLTPKRKDEKRLEEVDENKYGMLYLFIRIGRLGHELSWRYAIGAMFAIVSGMVYPILSIVFGQAISGFSELEASVQRFDGNRNALWFFIIAIVSAIAMGSQIYFFASAAAFLTSKLRSLSFKAILRQDIEYFDKDENGTGALTASLSGNPEKINGLAGVTLGAIVQTCSTLIGGSVVGLVYAYKPALVGIICFPFLFSVGYIHLRVVGLKDQQNKAAHESSAQLACEAAGAIRTVASLTREEDCLRLYSESLEKPLQRSNRTTIWTGILYACSQSVPFYVISLVFWYGSLLVSRLEIDMMSFFVVLMSTVFGMLQAGNVFSFVPDISSAREAGTAIVELIDSTPGIDAESTEGRTFYGEEVNGQIQLENVCFRYPTRPGVRVLQDLSLRVEPGTFVALVGASGCGKSTVIQMIERFYDPLSGRVLLDGKAISRFNVQEYRKQIALVSQEPTLYSGTIRFNVLLGAAKYKSEVTQEEIEAACRDANILDFIQSLPDGFDTQVGSNGSQLSGGQKQRIAIARALLRNPKVLLLDEATSALDSNSEKVVQEALDKAAKGRTTIAVAHRLSTIQNADCIYFLKEGRVSEAGTHDELLSLCGDYYEYVQSQALSKTWSVD